MHRGEMEKTDIDTTGFARIERRIELLPGTPKGRSWKEFILEDAVTETVPDLRSLAIELLTSIPGISTLSAQVILSEIGTDMSRFPTAGPSHLLGWPLSQQRRERRQTPIHPAPQGG